jgi:hypothetical protein
METKVIRIKSIKKIESDSKRYDIQTKKTNNFFANGILVHNSMMQVYFDEYLGKWFAATTGTAEGEGEVNNKMGTTFNDLFWQTASKYSDDLRYLLNPDYTYVFELTSPYNIVVTPHGVSSITLLTVRNNNTLVENSYEELLHDSAFLSVPLAETFNFRNMDIADVHKTLENMPWSEEGYVVCDKNFNRVKIKNPAYVAAHHTVTGKAYHNVIGIIKNNEIDEFLAYFVDRRSEMQFLQEAFVSLEAKLNDLWGQLKVFLESVNGNQKLYAEQVFKRTVEENIKLFTGLFFNLANGKVSSVREYINKVDNKILYNLLIEGFNKEVDFTF